MKYLFSLLFNPLHLPRLVWKNRTLLLQLVQRNIVGRYRGSMLGLIWSFIQPLMMLCVYTFVFSVVFQARWGTTLGNMSGSRAEFAIMMFCGIAVFTIFSESISMSCISILSCPNFVKKVIFPLEILPLSQVVSTFILGFVWFILLFFGSFLMKGPSLMMLLLPLVLIPLFLTVLGISFFVASLEIYLRDTQYIVGVILQVLFFMTPIFYSVEQLPERFRWVLQMNPLTILIDETRKVVLLHQFPDWLFLGISYLIGIAILQLGFTWFTKTKKGFADVL